MYRIIGLFTALVMAASLMLVPTAAVAAPTQPGTASYVAKYTPPVTCVDSKVSGRTRISQETTGFLRKQFYVDFIQGYKVCVNKLGPNFIRPTWYRYRYDVPRGVKCWKRYVRDGLHVVHFRSHFYTIKGKKVKSMKPVGIRCDSDGTASVTGRFGKRTSPSLNWKNSSKSGSPKMAVTVGVDWRAGAGIGRPDGRATIRQTLYARRN